MDTPLPPSPMPDASAAFENERKMMAAYVDAARTYSQLSLGALVLSVTFLEKFTATPDTRALAPWLVTAWICWLISTLSGAFYQYLAARFLEARGEHWGVLARGGHTQWFRQLASHPWPVYGVMLVTFALGSVSFVVYGMQAARLGP